ncbi:MAG: TolC family protein, partial [Candidatus Omnitrophica bacterium]|nr:TolC family protein [Candidatus Omnitrophota bacterium]
LVASKDVKEDKARLNILLGRSMEHEFNIQEDLREDELKLNFKELKETALAHDPDFKMEKLLLNIKKRNLTKEKLNRLPTFSLGFQKTNQDFEKDYSALISINIPFWNLNHGEVKKATAEKISQEAKVKSQETETVFDVYQAYLNAELARKQMELFRESLDESKELFVLAGLRYNEGKIDFLNYLDQVRTVREAQTNYYEGLFNLNESISELEKAVYASLRKEEYFDEKF